MKTLVTGGAGFIGSHLVERLVCLGHEVMVIDNFSTGRRENLPRSIGVAEIDLRDGEHLRAFFLEGRPDVVFHLAAQMNVRRSLENPAFDAEVNILGSLHVFEAASRARVARVVFASSGGAVYGEGVRIPCREIDLPRPISPYGVAKLAGEHYGRYFSDGGSFKFVSLRLANVYGPRQDPAGEAGVVSIFLEQMQEGRSPTLFGCGRQTRDFVFVEDVVQAFIQAGVGPPGIYNIGTGSETSIRELFGYIKEITDFAGEAEEEPAIPGEVARNALCIGQARSALGWSPAVRLEAGLQATHGWMKERKLQSSIAASRGSTVHP
jgi:UDP-glucose 4-epimerase